MSSSSKILISTLLLVSFLSLTSSNRQYIPLEPINLSIHITTLSFTNDGEYLVIGGENGKLKLVKNEKDQFLSSDLTDDSSLGNYVWAEFATDGTMLVSCTNSGKILVFKKNEKSGRYEEMQTIAGDSGLKNTAYPAIISI